jgi:hypothetical protein
VNFVRPGRQRKPVAPRQFAAETKPPAPQTENGRDTKSLDETDADAEG